MTFCLAWSSLIGIVLCEHRPPVFRRLCTVFQVKISGIPGFKAGMFPVERGIRQAEINIVEIAQTEHVFFVSVLSCMVCRRTDPDCDNWNHPRFPAGSVPFSMRVRGFYRKRMGYRMIGEMSCFFRGLAVECTGTHCESDVSAVDRMNNTVSVVSWALTKHVLKSETKIDWINQPDCGIIWLVKLIKKRGWSPDGGCSKTECKRYGLHWSV